MVVSAYHPEITERLREGAIAAYKARFGTDEGVRVFSVPGSFELAQAISVIASAERWHGFVALGCIVRGETAHDRVLGEAVTQGLGTLSLEVPVGLGVLTVETLEQARERAGGSQGNKGADAMEAALAVIGIGDRLVMEAEAMESETRSRAHSGGTRSSGVGGGPGFKPRRKESR